MWGKIKSAKWFIPVIVAVIVGVLATVGIVAAAWNSKTAQAIGTINITTTPPPPDYSFTLSANVDFGATSFAVGSPVSITGTLTVTNTGNLPIGSFTVASQNLPTWITSVTITQTPIAVGASVQETITLSGTAPSLAQLFNLVGPDVMHKGGITITPGS